jgi:hypothetical protein
VLHRDEKATGLLATRRLSAFLLRDYPDGASGPGATSPEKRGPTETWPGRKTETDRCTAVEERSGENFRRLPSGQGREGRFGRCGSDGACRTVTRLVISGEVRVVDPGFFLGQVPAAPELKR